MNVFQQIPQEAPVIVAEAVWAVQPSRSLGLYHHRGPILTVANWSGRWPGLVGMLNLNACLNEGWTRYHTLWSEQFCDEYFLSRLELWLSGKGAEHNTSHV